MCGVHLLTHTHTHCGRGMTLMFCIAQAIVITRCWFVVHRDTLSAAKCTAVRIGESQCLTPNLVWCMERLIDAQFAWWTDLPHRVAVLIIYVDTETCRRILRALINFVKFPNHKIKIDSHIWLIKVSTLLRGFWWRNENITPKIVNRIMKICIFYGINQNNNWFGQFTK